MFLKRRRFFYSILLVACLLLIGLIFLWKNFVTTPLIEGKSDIIYVAPGSSIYSVSQNLQAKGVLRYPKLFILLAKLQGKDKKLKAGEYKIDPGITPNQLLTKFVEGKVILRHFTIVEGWTLRQVFTSINSNRFLSHTLSKLTDIDISKKIGTQRPNVEGFLYPDTYLFAAGVQDVTILKKAYWNMHRNLTELWKNRAANLPYKDPYSALIVASLIEKETARPEERAKISGVIMRRLQKKMLLQIDASVIYGLKDSYAGKLTRNDLKIDTPFNTYLHPGLPPTPIGMPGMPSIIAALHPEQGNALYYVARGDGSHEFTNTLQQHHEAVKKYHIEHLQIDGTGWLKESAIPWFNNPNLGKVNLLLGFDQMNIH